MHLAVQCTATSGGPSMFKVTRLGLVFFKIKEFLNSIFGQNLQNGQREMIFFSVHLTFEVNLYSLYLLIDLDGENVSLSATANHRAIIP